MSDIVKVEQNELINLIHGKNGDLAMPEPFEKDVFLMDTHAAGTQYVSNMDEIFAALNDGDRIRFFREADNPFDGLAIVMKTVDGQKIGYVPRKDNEVFARLMDAGKLIFGRVISKYKNDREILIRVKVFMHE